MDEKNQAFRDLKAMQNQNAELIRQVKLMQERIAGLEANQMRNMLVREDAITSGKENSESKNLLLEIDDVKITQEDLDEYLNTL